MDVLQDKGEEGAVLLVEPDKVQDYIEQCVAFLPDAVAIALDDSAQHNTVVLMGLVIDHYRTVDPYGELVQEFPLVRFKLLRLIRLALVLVKVDKRDRIVFPEHQSMLINQDLRKDKNAIPDFRIRIIVIPDIAHGNLVVDILQGEQPIQDLGNILGIVLVFLNQKLHLNSAQVSGWQ